MVKCGMSLSLRLPILVKKGLAMLKHCVRKLEIGHEDPCPTMLNTMLKSNFTGIQPRGHNIIQC